MFPTNRGTCFSLNAIPTGMKTFDSCTVGARRGEDFFSPIDITLSNY
jgi:hypothetical protein